MNKLQSIDFKIYRKKRSNRSFATQLSDDEDEDDDEDDFKDGDDLFDQESNGHRNHNNKFSVYFRLFCLPDLSIIYVTFE